MLQYIINQLTPTYSPEEAREIAFWVLEELTGLDRFTLSACKDTKNISNIEIILERINKKEPIQYIFGHILWFGLDLKLSKATLIPRPETAELVDWLSSSFSDSGLKVLDIGTGSGCIALKLKQLHPSWNVTGIDISSDAIAIAKQNATRHHLDVSFLIQDIFQRSGLSAQRSFSDSGLAAKRSCSDSGLSAQRSCSDSGLSAEGGHPYDLVVSNPPYVMEREKVSMESTVLDYEPASALFVPDDDPLRFYRRIAELRLGTWLYFEINEQMGSQMRELLTSLGYTDIEIKKDSYGKERMVRARLAH